MELSIIIVSWNVSKLLKKCLESIYKQNFAFAFEVIVIDNNSADDSAMMVKNNFPQVKLIANQTNAGFAKANNQGLNVAQGDFYLLLNPDTEFIDSSLNLALNEIKQNQQIGVLGCKILNPDLTIQPSVRKFPSWSDHLVMMLKLHHLTPLKKYLMADFNYELQQRVDQVMGAFFLISKKLTEKMGSLDENFFIWFEEVDYCQRAKKAGFGVIYYPKTSLIHYGGQSFNQIYFKKQWLFSKSRLKYALKYNGWPVFILLLILTPLSIVLSWFNFKHGK